MASPPVMHAEKSTGNKVVRIHPEPLVDNQLQAPQQIGYSGRDLVRRGQGARWLAWLHTTLQAGWHAGAYSTT